MADSRVQLYHNVSTLLAAGVPIQRALKTAYKRGRFGRLFEAIAADVAAASSLAEAVEARAHHFDPLDVTLIRVGEDTGQLAEIFDMLSEWYAFRQRLRGGIRSGLILPFLMIHLLAFIAPVPSLALGGWDVAGYFRDVAAILAMFYVPGILIVGIFKLVSRDGPGRTVLDTTVLCIPVLGPAVRDLALSRYSKVFGMALKAGVPILNASRLAVDAAGNAVIRRAVGGGTEAIRQGRTMSEGFNGHRLPAEFVAVWQVGEETGDLDDSAARLGKIYGENAERRFQAIAVWVPRLMYVIVAAVMIYFIFKGFSQIYSNLGGSFDF